MGKLLKVARNVLGAGGEYISINDLIAEYEDGVTVNGAFVIDTQTGAKPCFTFAENANKYFYAVAGDIARLYEGWLSDCHGDINELNEELRLENIKIKIQKKQTRGGKTYTKAWVVGSSEKENFEEKVDAETGEILNAPF